MATALSDIKRRIGTTAQIQKVTGTLQRVAAAKLAQTERRIANADEYALRLQQLLDLACHALPVGAEPHPLTRAIDGDAIALVVFGSDRGLCGAYNSQLMKDMIDFLKDHTEKTVHVLFRGKVAYSRALRRQYQPIDYIESMDGLADRLMQDFADKRFCEVYAMYWDFISRANQQTTIRRILPVLLAAPSPLTSTNGTALDTSLIEPSPQALLDSLLPEYVRRGLYNAFHKGAAAEQAQRQAAMSRASDNAGELLTNLRKRFSRLRQETITTEMLEIVAGMNR